MIRKALAAVGLAAVVAWLAAGLHVWRERAPRLPPSPTELRGAWHVHTTRSDGRGTLDEVVDAARAAGLQFVIVTDHNVLAPEDQGWRRGVLVVEGTEASTRFGHLVALGVPRALSPAERDGDPFGAIAALGGEAVLAHPLHPDRPFTGWGEGRWRGLEIVSNDTSWGETVAGRAWHRVALAAAVLPFDGARAVLALHDEDVDERRRFDVELRKRRAGPPGPGLALFCSADAHGYPSYRAAFEAFSMHLPVVPSGDGAADARAVQAALFDGRAACVFDGVAPASGVRLAGTVDGRGLELHVSAPDLSRAHFVLLHDGLPVAQRAPAARSGEAVIPFGCEGGARCPPGDYRVEATWDGRPWIFTNPIRIE
jgi:hypothetical protein